MDKTQILALVQQKINEGILTQQDLDSLAITSTAIAPVHTKNITNIFYVIGAIIAVIGVIILLAQNWTAIGFVGRVLSTLGISIVAYVIGYVMTGNIHRVLSQTFFTISGILAPVGVFLFLGEFEFDFDALTQTLTAVSLFVLFFIAYMYTKRNILILWNMLWITWGYYALLAYLFTIDGDIIKWATIVIGITFLFVTYYIQKSIFSSEVDEQREQYVIQNILYGIGILLVIIPALSFNGIFDFITLILIFAAFYGSIFVKSRLTLVVSGVLLMSYILKITSKYFVDSIGWPLALIAIGFLVIAIGYGTLYVSRTYIPKNKI